MGEIIIKFGHSQITKQPRENRKPTAYMRALRKLTSDKKDPGVLVRIYTHINEDYKMLGIISLNTGGSVSFFPDFYGEMPFDHITLNKDFIHKKGHLTEVKNNGKHKKVFDIEATELQSGDFHLLTLVMKDDDLLMDCLKEIEIPSFEFDYDNADDFRSFVNNALNIEVPILEFPDEEGYYVIQIQILPKKSNLKDLNDVQILGDFRNLIGQKKPFEGPTSRRHTGLKTEDTCDFHICILCFKVKTEGTLESPFYIYFNQNSEKPLTAQDIKRIGTNE